MTRLALAAVLALVLAGCINQQTAQFAAADLVTAKAVANSPKLTAVAAAPGAIDPAGYACWGSLEGPVSVIAAGGTIGLAAIIEVARVAIIEVRNGGPCATLAQPLLAQIALLPGAGNAIALAAVSVQ